MKTVLITGAAGFIGSQLTSHLLNKGHYIIGLDNFNTSYDPAIKEKNVEKFLSQKKYTLIKGDILNNQDLEKCFFQSIDTVVHLAALAGTRSSINQAETYFQNNVIGTIRLLEMIKKKRVFHLIYGSSSSVYGESNSLPFSETDPTLQQISPYAASKKAAETVCSMYATTFNLKTTILRFFTVYGPHGRPDMAPYLFTKAILNDQKIIQFGCGNSFRDYTYIDDILIGIDQAIKNPFDFEIINLGSGSPISLKKFIHIIEKGTNKKAYITQKKIPLGDMTKTYASIEKAKELLDWTPQISLEQGIVNLISWLQKKN